MVIVWYIIASLIVSLIFGIQVVVLNIFNKSGYRTILSKYNFQFLFLIGFCIMYLISPVKISIFNFYGVLSLKNILIFTITVVITSFIVSFEKSDKHDGLVEWFIQGVAMEIPQRLFMQTFFMIVLANMQIKNSNLVAIIMNTIIWIQFIIVQDFMNGKKINKTGLLKILSSVCFSLGVGALYVSTGSIMVTMIAHGAERILSQKLGYRKS